MNNQHEIFRRKRCFIVYLSKNLSVEDAESEIFQATAWPSYAYGIRRISAFPLREETHLNRFLVSAPSADACWDQRQKSSWRPHEISEKNLCIICSAAVRNLGLSTTRASHGKRTAVGSGNACSDVAVGSPNWQHRKATNRKHRTTANWQPRQRSPGNNESEQSERQD
jgi:hypothetical protein